MSRSQWVFAATMAALGILGLATGGYVSIWTGVPKSLPGRELLFQASCVVSLATGVGLLLQRTGAIAARALLAYLVIWMLCFRVYPALQAPTVMISWWPVGESAVMVAAAWIVAMANGGRSHLRAARMLYGAGLIPFGIAHFFYLKETVVLVPAWLGSPTMWAYLTGAAYVAAGAAIVIGVLQRLAAVLSVWQMGLITAIVWIPMMAWGQPSAFQWGEIVDSWTLTVAGWVVAESYRGAPWLRNR
jgi:uncharacterized membrane protein